MESTHRIVQAVMEAKLDNGKADLLIRHYIPFIRAEASRFLGAPCTDSDDAFSIAMIAFHEAILGYDRLRGPFLSYAATLIRSRLIDEQRRQQRHQGHISLDEADEDARTMLDRLPDHRDHYEETQNLQATQQEIAELASVMAAFGVSFADVADQTPRQERTRRACLDAVAYATENRQLLDELLRTKKLPMNQLVLGSGGDRKTLERHRKYLLAMLLIQTNGYEIIRGHLRHVWKKGGVVA